MSVAVVAPNPWLAESVADHFVAAILPAAALSIPENYQF
jgi:hypothetical protein